MRRGERVEFVIGVGHPESTCQGAAFEYLMNIHYDLVKLGLRDRADLLWLSNEPVLGDFGVGGIHFEKRGVIHTSEKFIREIFRKYNIKWEVQKGVREVNEKNIYWEDYNGNYGETSYDFAMLIPQFRGVQFKYVDKDGKDISRKITAQIRAR